MNSFDLQDALLTAGIVTTFGGIYAIYKPLAFIVLGAAFLTFALLIQLARRRATTTKDKKS